MAARLGQQMVEHLELQRVEQMARSWAAPKESLSDTRPELAKEYWWELHLAECLAVY